LLKETTGAFDGAQTNYLSITNQDALSKPSKPRMQYLSIVGPKNQV